MLEQLALVDSTPEGFQAIQAIAEDFRKLKPKQRHIIIARYAVRYKPLVEFIAMIHKGYSPNDAAVKVNVIYGLGTKDNFVERNLLSLGLYSKILKKSGAGVELSVTVEELPEDYIDRLKEATKGEIQARLFLRERLGEEAYHYLGADQADDFVKALMEYRKDPRDAIVSIGRATEDFLRTVGSEKGHRDYSTVNGIGEISSLMRGEDPPLLLPGHLARTDFTGKLRNPGGGHGKDKETLERWDVTSEAALEAILVGLSCIKGVHAYAFQGRQVL